MTPTTNRRVALARVPEGVPRDDDFVLAAEPIVRPADGQLLVRSIYLSMDPYQRNWMAGAAGYGTPAVPGATIIGRAIGEVLESRAPSFAPGDLVLGETGWQTHALANADRVERVDRALAPLSSLLGVLGSPGLTAWVGMLDIGQPQPGETVVVSAATGAVGSVAGQIARLQGARVVGVAGAPDKCSFAVAELGYDACISHRHDDFEARLREACPNGVDVYFDNTGGAVTAAVYGLLRQDARIALCGLVAEYGDPSAKGPNMKHLLARQASVRAFSVRRNLHRMQEYRRAAAAWIASGTLRYREDVTAGIEQAPRAFQAMLAGRTLGKCLVQVGPDPTRA